MPDDEVEPFKIQGLDGAYSEDEDSLLGERPELQEGSFIGVKTPDEVAMEHAEEYQERIRIGNNRLRKAQDKVNRTMERLTREQLGIDGASMEAFRHQFLIDYIYPPDLDEDGNFGNPERIDYEIEWANAVQSVLDGLLQRASEAKLEAQRQQKEAQEQIAKQQRINALTHGVAGQPIDPNKFRTEGN